MALVFEGLSECPICKNVLDKDKEYTLTPPIISNTLDQLFPLSDAGIHVECLEKSPLKKNLCHFVELYDYILFDSPHNCLIDGQPVPRTDLVFFGLLTSDPSEQLFRFNHLLFNKHNISKWEDKDQFISIAETFIGEGKWVGLAGFNYLQYVLDRVKENY